MTEAADIGLSRRLWHAAEAVHAVAYFSPEPVQAATDLGLKGFWMGYFGFRAAPMGPVSSAVVEAAFFNFNRRRVSRAVPEAWRLADPSDMVQARAASAAASLRRLLGQRHAEELAARVTALLEAAARNASPHGRPLFAANRGVARPDDEVAALWQATTTLREHRGDGHVSLLVSAGLDGCQALVLFSLSEAIDATVFTASRGWSEEEWAAAGASLRRRGLVGADGLTDDGRRLRHDIERRTDELAWQPWGSLAPDDLAAVLAALAPAAARIAAASEIPFPNPIGLPRPDGRQR